MTATAAHPHHGLPNLGVLLAKWGRTRPKEETRVLTSAEREQHLREIQHEQDSLTREKIRLFSLRCEIPSSLDEAIAINERARIASYSH